MNRELEERLVAALEGLLEERSYNLEHQSRTSELLATGVTNNVLEVASRVFDTSAIIMLSFQATVGAIEVVNHGTNRVTVVGGASGTRSTSGPGVSHVEPGAGRIINVNNRVVTIFGTSGDLVGWQAYTVGGGGAGGA